MSNDTYNIAGTGINSTNTGGYNSQGASTTNTILASLSVLPNNSVLVNGLNGAYGTTIFTASGSTFTAPAGTEATLTYCPTASGGVCTTAATYVLTEHHSQTSYMFTSTGTMQLMSITDRNGNTVSVTPTTTTPTTVTDTRGRTVTNAYATAGGTQTETFTDNSLSRSWQESSPVGSTNYTQLSDPTGAVTNFTYTGGELTKILLANGTERLFGYDVNGRIDSVTQVTNIMAGTGPTTTFTWQAIPASTSPTPPPGSADEVLVTDPNVHTTTYIDGYGGQTLRVIDANNNYRSTGYNVDRQATQLTDAIQQPTMIGYASAGTSPTNNLTSVALPPNESGATPATDYFSYAVPASPPVTGSQYLPSSSVDAPGNCSAYSYDMAGNLTVNRVGLTPSGTTPNCDGVTSGGYATTNAYQGDGSTTCGASNGELCTTTSPGLQATSYGYDSSGELTSVTQPNGNCTVGTRTECTTYTYDAASRISTVTNGNGQVTHYAYDNDDRVTQILYNYTAGATCASVGAANCITYMYSHTGLLQSRTDTYGTISYGYDSLARLTSEQLPGNANACNAMVGDTQVLYGYDAANNLTSYCDAGGTVNYNYDPANNLNGVGTDGGTCNPVAVVQPCTTYTRDQNNRVTGITWPTSTNASEILSYYKNGQIHTVKATSGSTTLVNLSYSYVVSGTPNTDSTLLQSVNNVLTGVTTSYTYTNREAIQAATPTSGTSYGYMYGSNGNLTQMIQNGTVTKQLSQMSTGQLCWTLPMSNPNSCGSPPTGSTTYSAGTSHGYDNSGNETGNTPPSGTAESISYNPIDQSTSMTSSFTGTTQAMAYTGTDQSERTGDGTTAITNNAYGPASSTTGGVNTYFTYNPGATPNTLTSLLVGTARYYYLYDGQSNVIGLIDSSGNSVATYSYGPYGMLTSSGTDANVNPFRFQGGWHDSTGFDLFGTRYYNPMTGLWTQPDPKSPTIDNPASYLIYSFDSNDPINNTDPSGASIFGDVESFVGDVVQGVYYGFACGVGGTLGATAGGLLGTIAAPFTSGVSIPVGVVGGAVLGCAAGVAGAYGTPFPIDS